MSDVTCEIWFSIVIFVGLFAFLLPFGHLLKKKTAKLLNHGVNVSPALIVGILGRCLVLSSLMVHVVVVAINWSKFVTLDLLATCFELLSISCYTAISFVLFCCPNYSSRVKIANLNLFIEVFGFGLMFLIAAILGIVARTSHDIKSPFIDGFISIKLLSSISFFLVIFLEKRSVEICFPKLGEHGRVSLQRLADLLHVITCLTLGSSSVFLCSYAVCELDASILLIVGSAMYLAGWVVTGTTPRNVVPWALTYQRLDMVED